MVKVFLGDYYLCYNRLRYKNYIKGNPRWGITVSQVDVMTDPTIGRQFKYSRFEKARIIGARALQITMGAPILIEVPSTMIDPIKIALQEYEKGVIPITVKRASEGGQV